MFNEPDDINDAPSHSLDPVPPAHHRPTRLTHDRIIEALCSFGYRYFVDSDGDIGGLWDNRPFYFFQFGENKEILQVRGVWTRWASMDFLTTILEICNDWNREKIWPKAYVRVADNGAVQVNTEVSTDLEHGVTDDQLRSLIGCGIATGSMFFNELDRLFPDPLTTTPA